MKNLILISLLLFFVTPLSAEGLPEGDGIEPNEEDFGFSKSSGCCARWYHKRPKNPQKLTCNMVKNCANDCASGQNSHLAWQCFTGQLCSATSQCNGANIIDTIPTSFDEPYDED